MRDLVAAVRFQMCLLLCHGGVSDLNKAARGIKVPGLELRLRTTTEGEVPSQAGQVVVARGLSRLFNSRECSNP